MPARSNLTINGGDGNDTINGSAGDDLVIGGRGNDTALLGGGNDTYRLESGRRQRHRRWPGRHRHAACSTAPTSTRTSTSRPTAAVRRLTRDVGNITMDLNSVETIDFNALGGADTITVERPDRDGRQKRQHRPRVAAGQRLGDGQADTIIINATSGADAIPSAAAAGSSPSRVSRRLSTITGAEAANDRLVINGLGGDDIIDASGACRRHIQLTADGGDWR